MAYTIRFNGLLSAERVEAFLTLLKENVQKDGRFKIGRIEQPTERKLVWFTTSMPRSGKRPLPLYSTKHTVVLLREIRLLTRKGFCGQHPGECFIPPGGARKKRKTAFLEWDDWRSFNDLINSVLDAFSEPADMWSKPQEQMDFGDRFWLRRENRPRIQYSWEDDWKPGAFRPDQIWDHGSLDQFSSP